MNEKVSLTKTKFLCLCYGEGRDSTVLSTVHQLTGLISKTTWVFILTLPLHPT